MKRNFYTSLTGLIIFSFFFALIFPFPILAAQTKSTKTKSSKATKSSKTTSSKSSKTNKGKKSQGYTVSARSATFLDLNSMKRLYSKNVNMRVKPASTAKVMTALLVLEHIPLETIVTVRPEATNIQPSMINLGVGEQFKVADLLLALLMNSANDASIALAQAVAGSEAEFVRMMNARARELGAKNTNFSNSNGLPSPTAQYSSAYDMALIFKEALKHDFFEQAIRFRTKTIQSKKGRVIGLKSHNKMLFTTWGKNIYGKTGYTRAAKACFIGYTRKKGRTYFIAVFGCSRRWDDIRYILRHFGGIAI